jgi:hypothetical protein
MIAHQRRFSPFFLLCIASCTAKEHAPPAQKPAQPPAQTPPPATTTPPATTLPPYTGDNPINRALYPRFVAENITPIDADTPELCRRLSADLLGRYPGSPQIQMDCAGKSVDAIVRRFQSRPEYLLLSERHWRDQLDTTDAIVDWRYLKDLYALVDDLHTGKMKYGDFAIAALSHPGLILTEFVPDKIASHAFRAFMGRQATVKEAADLGALFRIWTPAQEMDPDFPYILTIRAYLLPYICGPLSSCSTTLYGGAKIEIPSATGDYIRWEDLDAIQKDALGEVGRLFVRQPFFWEAGADEILNRLLAWNDGGRFPRTVGALLPEVRQALADYLRETGDYPGAERIVMTSWLYTQTAHNEPDGHGDDPSAPTPPVYASGPLKPATAEMWIDSLAPLTFKYIGTCDPRYPDYVAFGEMYQAYMDQKIDLKQLGRDMQTLYMMQGNRIYFGPYQGGLGISEPSYTYTYLARLIGGCPGFGVARQEASGLAFGFGQETIAELACAPNAALNIAPSSDLGQTLTHQMQTVFGRDPTPTEIDAFVQGSAGCSGMDECSDQGKARSICTALLGSAEMLFY